MTPNEYIRRLAEALTRQEDLNDSEAKDVLFELALRIYYLLLRNLAEGRLDRYMQWPRLRTQITEQLIAIAPQIQNQLTSRLAAMELVVSEIANEYFGLPTNTVQPRPLDQLLNESRVVGLSLTDLFTPNPRTGVPPFVQQLVTLLEKQVVGAFFGDPPIEELVRKVVDVRSRAGLQVPFASKGTVANAWRDRLQSIVAAALWSTVQPAAERAAEAAEQLREEAPLNERVRPLRNWQWNAILDPRTCPVCRPLHRRIELDPGDFPQGPPPLHPRCRCVLIPVLG